MGRPDVSLRRQDLQLLHEALSYMRKRVFDQAEQVRLKGLVERLEDLLLESAGSTRLRLSPPEQEVLERQVEAYCTELTGRYAAESSRAQADRLRSLVGLFVPRSRKSWVRRLLGF